MALCGEQDNPNIAVSEVLARFDALLPDRERLARATGWNTQMIAEIDAYRGAAAVI